MKTPQLAVSPPLGTSTMRDMVLAQVAGCIAAALALTAVTMMVAHSVFNAMGLT